MKELFTFFTSHFSDFIIETFSVFLGFVSAFVLELFLDSKKDHNTKKNVINGIKRELNKIVTILNELGEDDFGIDLYDKPYWESVVSTGQVELLIEEPYYEDLVRTYHRITTANSWEGMNSQACLINGRINPTITKRVIQTRKELSEDIINMLKKIP